MEQTQQDITVNQDAQNNTPLFDPIDELDLQVNKNNKEDYEEVFKLLTQILQYPSTDQAQIHMDATRLGTQDLQDNIKERTKNSNYAEETQRQRLEYCPCCGFVKQEEHLKLCTPLSKISNIGISTYLYFQTIKNLVILLTVMTVVYSIYAFVTNLIASGKYDTSDPTAVDTTVTWVQLSLGSKQENQTEVNKTYYFISACIGAFLMLLWMVILCCLKYYEKEEEVRVEEETISASDFTIVIEGMPKDITQEELQESFDQYDETVKNVPAHLKRPFKIEKMNIGKPFYLNEDALRDEEAQKLKQKHEKMIEMFAEWIKERQSSMTFSTPKDKREEKYQEFSELVKKEQEKYEQLAQKIEEKIKEESQQATTTIFVTMETSNAMKVFSYLNDDSWLAKFRYYLTCCQGVNKFKFVRDGVEFDTTVERAPEPEDIIWSNLGVSNGEVRKRKFITYLATLFLLGVSFAAVYGLSQAQINNQNNQILSLVISVIISVINLILVQVIRRLSIMEKDYTETKHQTSLAIKAIVAQMINSILIPIIVNRFIKQEIYSENGLASDVFMLGLTNAFVAPIIIVFNPLYTMNRFFKWLYDSSPERRLLINQPEMNATYEYMIFQPGYEYVYLVNLFLFTCFFVSLQPIISVFAIAGMGMMYWAQKYSLFNRTRRPVPGTDLINVAMSQIILLGGILYSLGSLTWSNFFPEGIPKSAILPNLIALGISVLMALIPYRAFLASCFDDDGQICHEFKKCRMILPSEYDRLNPVTSAKGFEDYMNFIKSEEERYKNASEEEKKKMAEQLFKQAPRGQQRPMMPMPMPMMNRGGPGMMPPMMRPPPMMMPPPHMMGPRFPMQSGFAPAPQMMRPQGFTPSFVGSWGRAPNQPGFAMPNYARPPGFVPVQPQQPFRPPPQNFNRPPQQQPPQQGPPQQGPPPNFQQQPPQQFQQRPPPGFQPPGYQQGPPQGFAQGPPPNQQGFRPQGPPPPPGMFQPPPPGFNPNNMRR